MREITGEIVMSVRLSPYLGFKDNARVVMESYHVIFGEADIPVTDDEKDLMMHVIFEVPDRQMSECFGI